jgi:NAD-dependent deacetylase
MTTDAALPPDLDEALRAVRSVGVITGAGISAESGIPTYRGVGGIYDDPEEGDRTVEALSGPTLRADPDRTWRAVAALARVSIDARPNAAHEALARIEGTVDRCVILTQNVDGLHHEAGNQDIIDIHGNVLATRCTVCDGRGQLTRTALAALDATPRCDCGGGLRPDAVLFEEMLDPMKVMRLQDAFYRNPPDLTLVIGTTAIFPYIADPVYAAARSGRLTVEVNPEPTPLSDIVDWSLRGPAGSYVPLIADALA